MGNKLQIVLNQSTGDKKHKQIEAISKKTAKIEKMKKDLEILTNKINGIREKVDTQSSEIKNIFFKTKEEYILLLIEKHNTKGMALWQKELIMEFINEDYRLLMQMNYQSETLQNAYLELTKSSMENLSPFERKMRDEMFWNSMEEMGIEYDEELDLDQMNTPEFKKKMQEKIKEEFTKNQAKEKQKEKEKLVEKTDIDFQKLYKNLAKMVHPDLYKSEKEKEEKEHLMKQLTTAWETRDYYEIVMLWIEIDPKNTIDLELNDKNQKNIIKQLNDKIADLEYQNYLIKNEYHETSFYYHNFNAQSEKGIQNKILKYIKSLEITINRTKDKIQDYKKTTNLKNHLKEIYDERNENEMNFNELISHFGSIFDR